MYLYSTYRASPAIPPRWQHGSLSDIAVGKGNTELSEGGCVVCGGHDTVRALWVPFLWNECGCKSFMTLHTVGSRVRALPRVHSLRATSRR